jgi:hypothetical protein
MHFLLQEQMNSVRAWGVQVAIQIRSVGLDIAADGSMNIGENITQRESCVLKLADGVYLCR